MSTKHFIYNHNNEPFPFHVLYKETYPTSLRCLSKHTLSLLCSPLSLFLMSFLNLSKSLQPAKKAWKIFTSKLHKLSTSKAGKKPKYQLKTTRKAKIPSPSLSFKPRLHQNKRRTTQFRRCYRLQKRSAPIYIHDLLAEAGSVLKGHPDPPRTVSKSKGLIAEKCSTSSETVKVLPDQPEDDVPGTSKKAEGQEGAADEMWESLGFASPLMHGINERAEEFITRIRAEMQLQEMMARRL